MTYDALAQRLSLFERLTALKAEGTISEEEFTRAKTELMGGIETGEVETSNDGHQAIEPEIGAPTGESVEQPQQSYAEGHYAGGAQGFGRSQFEPFKLLPVAAVLILAAALIWFAVRGEAEAATSQSFRVTGTANVRSEPASKGSTILGKLKAGAVLEGEIIATAEGQKWVKIAEGKFAGAYVWSGNLNSDSQNEILAKEKSASSSSQSNSAAQAKGGRSDGCAVSTDRTLDAAVKEFCASYFEGADDDGLSYEPYETEFTRADFDGDGDNDALVAISSCEAASCHTTTRSTSVVSMLNTGTSFAEKGIRKLSGSAGLVRTTSKGAIFRTTAFGPDDPGCCPSLVVEETVTF